MRWIHCKKRFPHEVDGAYEEEPFIEFNANIWKEKLSLILYKGGLSQLQMITKARIYLYTHVQDKRPR